MLQFKAGHHKLVFLAGHVDPHVYSGYWGVELDCGRLPRSRSRLSSTPRAARRMCSCWSCRVVHRQKQEGQVGHCEVLLASGKSPQDVVFAIPCLSFSVFLGVCMLQFVGNSCAFGFLSFLGFSICRASWCLGSSFFAF